MSPPMSASILKNCAENGETTDEESSDTPEKPDAEQGTVQEAMHCTLKEGIMGTCRPKVPMEQFPLSIHE